MYHGVWYLKNSFYYHYDGGIYLASFITWCLVASIAHTQLYQYYKHTTGSEKKSAFLLLLMLIAFAGGSHNFLPSFLDTYPYGNFLVPIPTLFIAYAIFDHQFMQIEVLIKKSIVYSFLLATLSLIYLFNVILAETYLQTFIGYKSKFISISIIFVLGLIFVPLKNIIQNIVDKYFFKGTTIQLAQQNELLLKEVSEKERFKKVATLASGMAHEIKNPLTAIKTFSEYLHKHKDDPDFYQKFSQLVGKEVDRIDDLVHQLLEFSKPFPVELKESDVVKLIDDTLAFLDSQFLKSNITVQKNYLLQTPISITMDPVQIRQVFLNLFINSIDAMPKGGTLTVSINKNKRFVEITTTDNGIGIAKEDLKHIFEPFFTKKENGTGLGLSISYGIIEKHKGKIEVKSAVGVGTEFKIKLPLVKK